MIKIIKIEKLKGLEILFVFIVIFITFSIITPNFLKVNNIINIVRQIATLGIASAAMAFPLLIGGIDLSVGFQISMVNVVCAWLMVNAGMHPVPAVIAAMIMCTLIGFFNGLIIVLTKVPAMIVTLGVMNILTGISYMITGGLPIFGFPPSFKVIGQGTVFGLIPVSVIIMAVVFVLAQIVLTKTYFGRYFYAVGSNEEASKLSGVNTDFIKILAHTICGFLTAISAIVLLSRTNSGQSSSGGTYIFDIVTACVMGGVSIQGGKGTMYNVVLGVLIVGMLKNGLILVGANAYTQLAVNGVLMLVAVIYDTLSRARGEKIRRSKAINADNS